MTPCECGYEYRNWSKKSKDDLVKAIQGYTTQEFIEWVKFDAPYNSDSMMTLSFEEMEKLFLKEKQNKDE
jgi:hypothetical protein